MSETILYANVDWLAPVVGDRLKAACKYCSCILRAHYSDLRQHSKCAKHQKNAKTATPVEEPPLFFGNDCDATSM